MSLKVSKIAGYSLFFDRIRGYFERLEKKALESVLFIKILVIKKHHPQQIESQAQHIDSYIEFNTRPYEHLGEGVD